MLQILDKDIYKSHKGTKYTKNFVNSVSLQEKN